MKRYCHYMTYQYVFIKTYNFMIKWIKEDKVLLEIVDFD